MEFFRSAPISLCQLLLHNESAFNCIVELGYLGLVQFRNVYDETAESNNFYNMEIQRCNELLRILDYLQSEIDDHQIKSIYYPNVDEEEKPEAGDLKNIETSLMQIYEELNDVERNCESLRRQRNHLYERVQLLRTIDNFFSGGRNTEAVMAWSDSIIMHLLHDETRQPVTDHLHLRMFTGTIPIERFHTFEATVWRITRGNFYIRHSEIMISEVDLKRRSYQKMRKFAFMLIFVGETLSEKIAKMCQGFGIKLFQCPESAMDRRQVRQLLKQDVIDLDNILQRSEEHRYRILLIAAADIYIWRVKVKKMLMVFNILNHMKSIKHFQQYKYLQIECWVPTKEIPAVRTALAAAVRRATGDDTLHVFTPILTEIKHSHSQENVEPPTHFTLNRFTRAFQLLINAYGIAAYQELNPTPYTIITFPFLFAVMFGDIGHGIIMAAFGIWMILKEKQLEEKGRYNREPSEIWIMLFGGRYIIALMGLFSIYTGFIYNDCFSKAFNVFGTRWLVEYNTSTIFENHFLQLNPSDPHNYQGTPYLIGMDPIWHASGDNAITTFNSMKMKIAIILGVIHMMFGLSLSAFNHNFARNYSELYLVFLPQLLFLTCIFFYLVILIFFKWMFFGGNYEGMYHSSCAPSILITFINMLLMKEPEDVRFPCEVWMYDYQNLIQYLLLFIALVSVPILLAGRPIFIIYQQNKVRRTESPLLRESRTQETISSMRRTLVYAVESNISYHRPKAKVAEHNLTELWIHSGIHCIESVLGSVSHTASYLRLWALSLAHAQLSSVLWNMVLQIGLAADRGFLNSLVIYVVFSIWATLTIAILIVMEGLSAFLHTLRLHWVEFQSKFYSGSGEMFTPFKFPSSNISS